MDVLSSRVLLRPTDLERSIAWYRDVLGLAVYREYPTGDGRGVVFFLGGGRLELAGEGPADEVRKLRLWVQVRDLDAEHERLRAAGATIVEPPEDKHWGLREMTLADPDGVHIVAVQIPDDHPLRRRRPERPDRT